MLTPKYFSRKEGQRGLAMTEFVIVLPVMLLLMLATAELGRAFYQYNILTKAVRDGARYLASNAIQGTTGVININQTPETCPQPQDLVMCTQNLVVYGKLKPNKGSDKPLLEDWSTSTVTATTADAIHVQVGATFLFKPIFSKLPTFGFGQDIDLGMTFRASAIMRAL